MKPILEIQGIGKKYQIEGNRKPYLSLRENLFTIFKSSARQEEFWALKDISLDIMPGDTVGIIGRNGAGKSTLLKILSKITPPTTGKITARGRIASLLEVGTGFHSELNGRENVYMNGSILGLKKSEIDQNFDAIVDFAGVEKFINTPLKHYSSGMQLRLAFAVAAFLQNEVLIIDEVLAVGDAAFQKKCLSKIEEVSGSGRTLIFVSHTMNIVSAICKKAVWLDGGRIQDMGSSQDIISKYISNVGVVPETRQVKKGNETIPTFLLTLKNEHNEESGNFRFNEKWSATVEYTLSRPIKHMIVAMSLKNLYETIIRTTWSVPKDMEPGNYRSTFYADDIFLEEGSYSVSLGFSEFEHALLEANDVSRFATYCDADMLKHNIIRAAGTGVILNQLRVDTERLN